jgi:tRNA1(Val) A37 N6-methylase TrmN6
MDQEATDDIILGGRVRLRQPARGFRAGVDSVLLAAAVEAQPGATLMEAGCGAGAALLCVAVRLPGVRLLGVERDPGMVALARDNIARNALALRVSVEEGDALLRGGASFDGVFVNPPFDDAGAAQAPHPARAAAYLTSAPIDAWIKALADRLTGGATLTMIHRAARLGEILAALDGRLGGVEILPLRPRAHAPAKRVLVRARKGSRAPLALFAGLDLHDDAGAKYTPGIEAILRGEAPVLWR